MSQATAERFDFTDDASRKKRTNQLVRLIKTDNEDFEWYPTTQENIDAIRKDILKAIDPYERDNGAIHLSFMDIGAGDGRVLSQLTSGQKFAIEKASSLVDAMDTDIFVIGSDVFGCTLLDKAVDVIFCNPPYKSYEAFAKKIITEANCAVIYLIMPYRWKDSLDIKHALSVRKCEDEVEVIGHFDFYNADRQARAKVDIVKIELGSLHRHRQVYRNDPFDIWFEENFPLNAPKTAASEWVARKNKEEELRESFAGEITKKRGVIPVLAEMYQSDLAKLMETYKCICDIPYELIKELDISTNNVKAALKLKIQSLKDVYWRKLFDELNSITDKLISDTREKILTKLTSSTSVDFTVENASNVVIWAIKQSNKYFDEQILTIFERMTESANIELYKSNQRTIAHDGWRYTKWDIERFGEYKLDYRIVLHKVGGYCEPDYNCRGLSRSAVNLVDDLCVIARHLGFDVNATPASARDWQPGKPHTFSYINADGKECVLLEVRAFKKGNIHIKLDQRFIQKLNVVHGRLKGWVKSAAEAAKEMDIPIDVAEDAFAVTMRLGANHPLLLSLASQSNFS